MANAQEIDQNPARRGRLRGSNPSQSAKWMAVENPSVLHGPCFKSTFDEGALGFMGIGVQYA